MTKSRLAVAAILALLATTVILQNTRQVETKILFFTLHLPHAVLLLATLLAGFALGVVLTMVGSRRSSKKDHKNPR